MNSEHFTYLQEPGEESWQTFCLDTYLSGLARSKPVRGIYSSTGKKTESCLDSQYGETLPPSTENRGEDLWTFFAVDSPVRMSATKEQTTEQNRESTEIVRDFGASIEGLSKRCSLALSLPRTPRILELADLSESSKTLPVWGMMQDGVVWELATSEQTTRASASGLLPTVLATDWKGGCTAIRKDKGKQRFDQWRDYVKIKFGMTYPHPTHSELRMGWPENWTGSEPLEMGKFQRWLASHGISSQPDSTWKEVSFAADCLQSSEWEGTDEPGDICSLCGLDYCEECQCPGPTQDGMEYEEFHGVLMARPILGDNKQITH
jgi:hypothetical protein